MDRKRYRNESAYRDGYSDGLNDADIKYREKLRNIQIKLQALLLELSFTNREGE